MAEYLTNYTDLKAVADAIRTKAGSTAALSFPDGFITAVNGIQTGGTPNLQSKSVTYTANGTNTITPDAGYDGLSSVDVTVDVSGGEDVIIKQVTFNPSSNYLLSSDKCVVTHNCGKIPKAVFIFSDNTNSPYVGYGYIFNFRGSNNTTNVSMYTSFGFHDGTYSVAFTTTTMKFTMDSHNRYKGGKQYDFTFVC